MLLATYLANTSVYPVVKLAVYAYAYTSGMAAITAALRLVPANGNVLAGNDIYGGTSRWLENLAPRAGMSVCLW